MHARWESMQYVCEYMTASAAALLGLTYLHRYKLIESRGSCDANRERHSRRSTKQLERHGHMVETFRLTVFGQRRERFSIFRSIFSTSRV